MGLDMYLTGRSTFTRDAKPRQRIGEQIALGYWRKHPNLHGFIVNTFADGNDDCREIQLTLDDLDAILTAIEQDALPHTEGFFFGESSGDECDDDLATFRNAKEWLLEPGDDLFRHVVYQASW